MLARQQRLGQHEVQVILFKPAFGTHLDHIAEALRGDQRRLRPASFDQRIGGKRRAMNDLTDLCRVHPRLGADLMHAINDRVFRRCISRQHLRRMLRAVNFNHHVGEGTADINAQPDLV